MGNHALQLQRDCSHGVVSSFHIERVTNGLASSGVKPQSSTVRTEPVWSGLRYHLCGMTILTRSAPIVPYRVAYPAPASQAGAATLV
jgi:hypothetical protein